MYYFISFSIVGENGVEICRGGKKKRKDLFFVDDVKM